MIISFIRVRAIFGALKPFRHTSYAFTYVAIGDSTVEGIGASVPAKAYAGIVYSVIKLSFHKATYHNFGKSGARVQDVLAGQTDKAIAANPDLITLSVGANDIVRHTKLADFRSDLTGLIEKLQAGTHAMIVVTNVPNFSTLRSIPHVLKPVAKRRIKQFNGCILEVARAHNVDHIDTYHHSTILARQFPEAVASDNFHPSDFGYAIWASMVMATIQQKLAQFRLGQAATDKSVTLHPTASR